MQKTKKGIPQQNTEGLCTLWTAQWNMGEKEKDILANADAVGAANYRSSFIHDDIDRIGIISETVSLQWERNECCGYLRIDVRTERVYTVHEKTCNIILECIVQTKWNSLILRSIRRLMCFLISCIHCAPHVIENIICLNREWLRGLFFIGSIHFLRFRDAGNAHHFARQNLHTEFHDV